MKSIWLAGLAGLFSLSAYAYQDGLYQCAARDGVPGNTYMIQTLALTPGGASLPYVEATFHFRSHPADPISTSVIRGFATIVSVSDGAETFFLGAVRLEMQNGEIPGCPRTGPIVTAL